MRILANRHQFKIEVENLDRSIESLMDMIDGYPYLARLAYYALSTENITFEQLIAEAPTAAGIYRNHLQGHLVTLQKYSELGQDYQQIVMADEPINIFTINAYKLESIGLVKLTDNRVEPSCQLYRLYFREYLNI